MKKIKMKKIKMNDEIIIKNIGLELENIITEYSCCKKTQRYNNKDF